MSVSAIRPIRSERQTPAQRVLAVLETFGPDHIALSLSEISWRSGLTLTTTHRTVAERRDWAPSIAVATDVIRSGCGSLSSAHAAQGLRGVALPFLGELQQTTQASVHLPAPIRGRRDRVGAVGITVATGSTAPHAIVPALAATASTTSRALGASCATAPPGARAQLDN